MQDRITVRVVPFPDRPALQLQWRDPASGERKTRSAKTADEGEAERKRADLEYELNHDLHRGGTRTSWERFRECFEAEYLPGVRSETRKLYGVIFDHVERICHPTAMDGVTARTLSQLVAGLRQVKGRGKDTQGMQPSTIFARLASLKAALRWAHQQGMISSVPAFPEIKVPKRRPQPVAADLYERLFAATNDLHLRAFVACGWLAGLRRNEAHLLSWESSDRVPWLDFGRSRIWLPAGFVKAVEDQWLPLDPALRQLLEALPRTGSHVFPWHGLTHEAAGQKVIALAKAAGVPLTMRTLRRGFGCRLAEKVPAQVLQKLMRHSSIDVTMDFYVNIDQAAMEAILGTEACRAGFNQ